MAAALRPQPKGSCVAAPIVDIVIPVHNEARVLADSIGRLHRYLSEGFAFSWRITIVDNGSVDATWTEATVLAARYPEVRAIHLDAKGRGRALRRAWSESDAAVVAYMDVDLSTDLAALLPLIAPLVTGHSDLAIGSRLATGAHVVRGPRREAISRAYNRLLRVVFRNQFRDAQCGFKAVRADVARYLLPVVRDEAWFFDTELLLVAERNGLRITEVPVDWIDDTDSRVRIVATAWADLKGMARVARAFWRGEGRVDLGVVGRPPIPAGTGGELVTFVAVGILSTMAQLAMFLVLRPRLGPVTANAVALTVAAVGNTAAHRRWTFGRRGSADRTTHWARAGSVYLAGLALTTVALVAAHAVQAGSLTVELVLLAVTSVVATALRFSLMPAWVFRKAVR
jgi:putative flippase GtrA